MTNQSNDQSNDQSKTIVEYYFKLAQQSYEMEIERYKSLTQAATSTLTANSILSVGIVTFIPFIYPLVHNKELMLVMLILIFASISISFICSLLMLWRYDYNALPDMGAIFQNILMQKDNFTNSWEIASHFTESLASPYASIEARNDKLGRLQKASVIFQLVCVFLAIASAIILIGR